MASYVELTHLMNRANEQTEQLAKETTTKDIVEILNNSSSTPAEIQVAAKALEMTSTAAKKFSETKNRICRKPWVMVRRTPWTSFLRKF